MSGRDPSQSLGIPAKAIPAWKALDEALQDARAAGRSVPCQGANSEAWTADDKDNIAYAQAHCAHCPLAVAAACGRYAEAAKEPTGVWSGINRSKLGKKNKKINESEAA